MNYQCLLLSILIKVHFYWIINHLLDKTHSDWVKVIFLYMVNPNQVTNSIIDPFCFRLLQKVYIKKVIQIYFLDLIKFLFNFWLNHKAHNIFIWYSIYRYEFLFFQIYLGDSFLIIEICFEVYDKTLSFYLYDLMKEFIFRFLNLHLPIIFIYLKYKKIWIRKTWNWSALVVAQKFTFILLKVVISCLNLYPQQT